MEWAVRRDMMRGMEKAIFRFLAALLLTASASAQSVDELALQCVTPATQPGEPATLVAPMSSEETVRLRQAPHGAKRLGKHQLEVGWTGGRRMFRDRPPFDEPLDGIAWQYCGYSAVLKVHLVGKSDRGLFTGVLLDDISGSLLPGGEAVLFSPDRQLYLSYEQPDGQDGETLRLYKRSGVMLWKGLDCILSPDGKSVIVDSENMRNMRWDDQNRPQATLHLKGDRTLTVTLMPDSKGQLDWLPHIQE